MKFYLYIIVKVFYYCSFMIFFFRVSVERARGTPRGSDVWRGSGRGGDLPLQPPRRPRRDARYVLQYYNGSKKFLLL